MSDWIFNEKIRPAGSWFNDAICYPKFGDAFSPDFPIPPADNLMFSSLNWTTKGSVKFYAADMTFIAEYGPGEEYLLHDPAHFAMGKCVIVASSDDIEYHCLKSTDGSFLDGEILNLLPNEERTFTGLIGKAIIVSEGELAIASKTYPKHASLIFEATDTITVTAGDTGAMLALFWRLL